MLKYCMALSPTKANFAPLLFAGDMQLGMETAAQLGYDGVELNLRDSTALDQDEILKNLQAYGLHAPSIGTGQSYFHDNLSLADPCEQNQTAVRERLRGHIQFASRLGAAVVLGSIRGKLDKSSPQACQASYDTAVDAARDLADFAATLGVTLTVEPINRYETNFLNSIAETIEFIDAVGRRNLGVLADTFHMNLEEANMVESLKRAGNRLAHVHFADSNRYAPGMGHLNFDELMAVLSEAGYDGYASAEIIPVPDSFTAAKTWMATIRPITTARYEGK
jgi:sugar phosphate isomerase/epimerase